MPSKRVELYERDGAVFRRVTRDLGSGIRSVTSDIMFHPDIKEFARENPDVRIQGYHPSREMSVPSPTRFTLDELPEYLQSIDSIDALLVQRRRDDRKMAQKMYEERLEELLDEEFGEDEDDA